MPHQRVFQAVPSQASCFRLHDFLEMPLIWFYPQDHLTAFLKTCELLIFFMYNWLLLISHDISIAAIFHSEITNSYAKKQGWIVS